MKFVDRAVISVKAGNGGQGRVSFRREKFVPRGGPDGGDGGKGGDVIFEASSSLQTLMDLVIKRHYAAQNGAPGGGQKMFGLDGKDTILKVPCGTVVLDEHNNLLVDLIQPGERYLAAKGGKGGKGNVHFASSTNQAPRYAQSGLSGEENSLVLELKLLAQVGLIGLPNAGKSTLLKALTRANPKIADYPFTTLYPNLGVLKLPDREFVLADIPGLIEGASEGHGLGADFLRHVDRTELLLHVVEIVPGDPLQALQNMTIVDHEIHKSHPNTAAKKQVVVLNKIDLVASTDQEMYCKPFSDKGLLVIPISAATSVGIPLLINAIQSL